MDERNFSNIFRKATGNFFCPSCGAKYQGTEIESIERHENGYLVSIACSSCKLKLSMHVVTKGFSTPDYETEVLEQAITADEIIDLHNELQHFDGNFHRVFSTRIDQNRLF
jgi:transcription elongation factor Elf1